jgi:hypothetical protein
VRVHVTAGTNRRLPRFTRDLKTEPKLVVIDPHRYARKIFANLQILAALVFSQTMSSVFDRIIKVAKGRVLDVARAEPGEGMAEESDFEAWGKTFAEVLVRDSNRFSL